jgi:hypothetical protein
MPTTAGANPVGSADPESSDMLQGYQSLSVRGAPSDSQFHVLHLGTVHNELGLQICPSQCSEVPPTRTNRQPNQRMLRFMQAPLVPKLTWIGCRRVRSYQTTLWFPASIQMHRAQGALRAVAPAARLHQATQHTVCVWLTDDLMVFIHGPTENISPTTRQSHAACGMPSQCNQVLSQLCPAAVQCMSDRPNLSACCFSPAAMAHATFALPTSGGLHLVLYSSKASMMGLHEVPTLSGEKHTKSPRKSVSPNTVGISSWTLTIHVRHPCVYCVKRYCSCPRVKSPWKSVSHSTAHGPSQST